MKKADIITCMRLLTVLFALLLCGCGRSAGGELKEHESLAEDVKTDEAGKTPAEDTKQGENEPEETKPENTKPADDRPADTGSVEGGPFEYTPVTISFAGDVYPGKSAFERYEQSGIEGVFSRELLEVMQGSDIMVMNHECCATDLDEENAVDYQIWIEQVPRANDIIFKEAGADILSLANNHCFDYGEQGFLDTLSTLEALDIEYVGAGRSLDEAAAVKVMEAGGKRIAFVSANAIITMLDWVAEEDKSGMTALYNWSPSYAKMIENVQAAAAECDLVVALLHSGTEKQHEFSDVQQEYFRALIDAGADLVIGAHPHVLQGMEYYKDGVIFYSLGNFLFSSYYRDTCVITLTLFEDNSYELKVHPCATEYFYTWYAHDNTAYELMNTYSVNARIDEDGILHFCEPEESEKEDDQTEE